MDNEHLSNEEWASDVLKSLAASKLAAEVQKASRDVYLALRNLDPKNLTNAGFKKLPEQVRRIYDTLSPEHDYDALTKQLRLLMHRCGGVLEVMGKPLSPRDRAPDTPEAAKEAHQELVLRKRIEARLPPTLPSAEELRLIEVHCEKIGEFCEALAKQPAVTEGAGMKGTDFCKAFEKAKEAGVFKALPLRLIVPGKGY